MELINDMIERDRSRFLVLWPRWPSWRELPGICIFATRGVFVEKDPGSSDGASALAEDFP